MKIIIDESQYKKIQKNLNELTANSSGVKELLNTVKETKGLLKFLKFPTHKALKEFILDGSIKDLTEIRDDIDEFFKKKENKK